MRSKVASFRHSRSLLFTLDGEEEIICVKSSGFTLGARHSLPAVVFFSKFAFVRTLTKKVFSSCG